MDSKLQIKLTYKRNIMDGYILKRYLAECPESLYGYNCDKQCSENCGDPSKCDRKTGQCKDGCQAGWTEDKCEKGEFLKDIWSGLLEFVFTFH